MLDRLQSDTLVRTDWVGDVVSVLFSQEDELALFMPQSGDVLLCSLRQWQQLAKKSVPASELECTLRSLGACLDQALAS